MGIDTRIAVVIFLFYLLNGILAFDQGQPFLPPFFMESYLLGGASLIYFILSIRSLFSVLFLLLAFHFAVMLYYPVLPQQPIDWIQWFALLIPVVLPVVLYTHVFIFLKTEKNNVRWMWIFHLVCFVVSFWPAIFNSGAMVSIIAGVLQAATGILLLSHGDSSLSSQGWKKRMVLIMILIVFFDLAQHLYLFTLPAA